jgi:hypothetical protein
MSETEKTADISFRFEELDDTTVSITFVPGDIVNGAQPYNLKLIDVNWGMLDDILELQETAKDNPRVIFNFLDDHIEGGARPIPIKYTMSLFAAIAEYMNAVMSTQKN